MYSPKTPVQSSCMPPISQIEYATSDSPPPAIALIIIVSALIAIISMPSHVMNVSGFTLNDVMPSMANESIFFSGYFVSPANRSARSYGTIAAG